LDNGTLQFSGLVFGWNNGFVWMAVVFNPTWVL
jgi:hypothetical protein